MPTFDTDMVPGTNAREGVTEVFLSPTNAELKYSFGSGDWLIGSIKFNYVVVGGRHLIWFDVAPNRSRFILDRFWTMQIWNSLDPSERITLKITQEGNSIRRYIPNPEDDIIPEEEDGFDGLLGVGSGEETEEDGDPDWTIGSGDIFL